MTSNILMPSLHEQCSFCEQGWKNRRNKNDDKHTLNILLAIFLVMLSSIESWTESRDLQLRHIIIFHDI